MSNLDDVWQDEVKEFKEGTERPDDEILHRYFGESFIMEYKEEFKKKVWKVPYYGICTMHVLLGQLPNIRNMRIRIGGNYEDCRVHFFLLQESGTGKGKGFDFTQEIANRLGLNFKSSDKLTENSLLGSVDENDEIIYGSLDPSHDPSYDIFASEEGSRIVDTRDSNYSQEAVTTFQKVMNSIGSHSNRLSKDTGHTSVEITFHPHVSLFLTSYPPDRLFDTITETGLIQRMLVLYNSWSLQDKVELNQKFAHMLETDKDMEVEIMNLVNVMKKINEFYRDKEFLTVTEDARKILKEKIIKHLHKPLPYLDKHTQEEMRKFTTRYQLLLYKLAWHRAMTRLSEKVEKRDLGYARNLLKPIYNRLIGYMETEFRVDEREVKRAEEILGEIKDTYHQLSNNGSKRPWIRQSSLEKALKNRWRVSREAVRQKIKQHGAIFQFHETKYNEDILRLRKNPEKYGTKRI